MCVLQSIVLCLTPDNVKTNIVPVVRRIFLPIFVCLHITNNSYSLWLPIIVRPGIGANVVTCPNWLSKLKFNLCPIVLFFLQVRFPRECSVVPKHPEYTF